MYIYRRLTHTKQLLLCSVSFMLSLYFSMLCYSKANWISLYMINLSEDNVRASEPCESCDPWLRVMRANMGVTQLLKASRFKMGV